MKKYLLIAAPLYLIAHVAIAQTVTVPASTVVLEGSTSDEIRRWVGTVAFPLILTAATAMLTSFLLFVQVWLQNFMLTKTCYGWGSLIRTNRIAAGLPVFPMSKTDKDVSDAAKDVQLNYGASLKGTKGGFDQVAAMIIKGASIAYQTVVTPPSVASSTTAPAPSQKTPGQIAYEEADGEDWENEPPKIRMHWEAVGAVASMSPDHPIGVPFPHQVSTQPSLNATVPASINPQGVG